MTQIFIDGFHFMRQVRHAIGRYHSSTTFDSMQFALKRMQRLAIGGIIAKYSKLFTAAFC